MTELNKILCGLVRRTEEGALQWKSAVAGNEFIATVDAISIVVRGLGVRNFGNPDSYQLVIIDENGLAVEAMDIRSGFDAFPMDEAEIARNEPGRKLVRLFDLARRSALNTQATLDKLARALES